MRLSDPRLRPNSRPDVGRFRLIGNVTELFVPWIGKIAFNGRLLQPRSFDLRIASLRSKIEEGPVFISEHLLAITLLPPDALLASPVSTVLLFLLKPHLTCSHRFLGTLFPHCRGWRYCDPRDRSATSYQILLLQCGPMPLLVNPFVNAPRTSRSS
jgi:hypothetical protein